MRVDSTEQPIRSLKKSKKFTKNMIWRVFFKYLTFLKYYAACLGGMVGLGDCWSLHYSTKYCFEKTFDLKLFFVIQIYAAPSWVFEFVDWQ